MLKFSDHSKRAEAAVTQLVPDPVTTLTSDTLQLPICRVEPKIEELLVRVLYRMGGPNDGEFLRTAFPGYLRVYNQDSFIRSGMVSHHALAVVLVKFLNRLRQHGIKLWGPSTVKDLLRQMVNAGMLAKEHSGHGACTLMGRILSDPQIGIQCSRIPTANKRFLWRISIDQEYPVPKPPSIPSTQKVQPSPKPETSGGAPNAQ